MTVIVKILKKRWTSGLSNDPNSCITLLERHSFSDNNSRK